MYRQGTDGISIIRTSDDAYILIDKDNQDYKAYQAWLRVQQNVSNEVALTALREQRDQLLSKSDWTQVADSPLSGSAKTAWATYRQALRDLPENTVDPKSPSWPTPP